MSISLPFALPSPYGNTLIMSPWNYPLLLTIEPLALYIFSEDKSRVQNLTARLSYGGGCICSCGEGDTMRKAAIFMFDRSVKLKKKGEKRYDSICG